MGSLAEDTYLSDVPEHVDKSQDEWSKMSYHSQRYYAENRLEEQRESDNRRRAEKKAWVHRIKAEVGCSVCSEDEPACLVFHHVEEKEDNIGSLIGKNLSWNRIEDEIKRCVVLCSNCHRKHHAGLIETERFK